MPPRFHADDADLGSLFSSYNTGKFVEIVVVVVVSLDVWYGFL